MGAPLRPAGRAVGGVLAAGTAAFGAAGLPLRALVRDEAADERVFFFPVLPDDFDCAMYQIPSIAFAGRLQRAAVKPLHTSCM